MLMLIRRNFTWIITVGHPFGRAALGIGVEMGVVVGVGQMKGPRVLPRGTVADLNSC